MNDTNSHIAQQLAHVASVLQQQRMFLLTPEVAPYTGTGTDADSIERADDDGFRPAAEPDTSRSFMNL